MKILVIRVPGRIYALLEIGNTNFVENLDEFDKKFNLLYPFYENIFKLYFDKKS